MVLLEFLKKILIIYSYAINNYMNSFIQHYNLILESFKDAQTKWSINNNQAEVKSYIGLYKKLKQNKGILKQVSSGYDFNIEDISQWINKDFNEFKDFIDNAKNLKSKSQVTKDVKLKGADKVFENEYVTIVVPKTHKASCYYGSGTKWCTTAKSSMHWDDYADGRTKFYYILHKQLDSTNDMYKVAVAVGYNNSRIHIFNASNDNISGSEFLAYLEKYKIPSKGMFTNVWTKHEWLSGLNHTINEDGSIDVDGDVSLGNFDLPHIPFKFNKVSGDFYISHNRLKTLDGAPKIVGGGFYCSGNGLTSLEGSPQTVGDNFDCSDNKLTVLSGAPLRINGSFNCDNNTKLTTLEGAPTEVIGGFYCSGNRLTTLTHAPKTVGADFRCGSNILTNLNGSPQIVGGDYYCSFNKLTSLIGMPLNVNGHFWCTDNKLITLEHAPNIGGNFYCDRNMLTSLKGMPSKINGIFSCCENMLTNLKYSPKSVGGSFYCSNNRLTTLEGAPNSVDGGVYCFNNKLTSLEGSPQHINGDFNCKNNPLKSLEGKPKHITGAIMHD